MSDFITEEKKQDFLTFGWCVIRGIVPEPNKIANSIIDETLKTVFQSAQEKEAVRFMEEDGKDPLLLLTSAELREEYLDDPANIWHQKNTRNPKVSKSTGMSNIYHNNLVRDKISFNENIYNVVSSLYTALSGKEEDCIHLYGPDRICIKPKNSTDMDFHIDCDLVDQGKGQIPSSATHPLTMFRVQTVCTVMCDYEEKFNGRTEILSGYNNYFVLGTKFFAKHMSLIRHKNGREFRPLVLNDVFKKHLPSFLEHVKSFYYEDDESLVPFEKSGLKEEEKYIYDSLPKTRVEIEWLKPHVRDGDMLCFDQRLPHRNTKNKSAIPRVAAFVSLYPKSYMDEEDLPPLAVFEGEMSKTRDTYANTLEQEYFKDVWKERITFEKTPLIRKMLGVAEVEEKPVVVKVRSVEEEKR
jgi:hypothetical protein